MPALRGRGRTAGVAPLSPAASPAPATAAFPVPSQAARLPAAPGAGDPVPPLGPLGHLRLLGIVTLILVVGCGTVGALAGGALALLGGDWDILQLAVKVGLGAGLLAAVAGTANYLFDLATGKNR